MRRITLRWPFSWWLNLNYFEFKVFSASLHYLILFWFKYSQAPDWLFHFLNSIGGTFLFKDLPTLTVDDSSVGLREKLKWVVAVCTFTVKTLIVDFTILHVSHRRSWSSWTVSKQESILFTLLAYRPYVLMLLIQCCYYVIYYCLWNWSTHQLIISMQLWKS